MKANIARVVIALLVMVELAWFIVPSHKSLMGETYRNTERIGALTQYSQDHSPAKWGAVQKEMDLLYKHDSNRKLTVMVILMAVDIALVFFFWNFVGRNVTGSPLGKNVNKHVSPA